jgi:hypothetical protein
MYNKNKTFNQGGYSTDYPVNQAGKRSNVYVNPNYKPANKYIRPGLNTAAAEMAIAADSSGVGSSSITHAGVSSAPASGTVTPTQSSGVGTQKKEIVLGGVAFESSSRSLVRKDCERSLLCPYFIINPTLFLSFLSSAKIQQTSVGWKIGIYNTSPPLQSQIWTCAA